ncbi:MAG: DUF4173 domain-containing protein [Anaerolineales bacterium]
MPKSVRPKFLLPISLTLAWTFDYLFWGKAIGISFPIFALLVIGVGLWFVYRSGQKPARNSMLLLIPIIFFVLVSVVRLEGFTLFLALVLTFLLMAVFALTLLGGRWPAYSFSDYFVKLLLLFPRGLGLVRSTAPAEKKGERSGLRRLAPIARGLFLALPLLWFLGLLLSAADPVFARVLEDFFAFLNIDNFIEYVFRTFYILILAYLLAGAFLFARFKSKKEDVLGQNDSVMKPFLGFGEAATVLASVNMLFAAFVFVQLRYFFGGAANINNAGFTYAEYARRGFGEMVTVASVSLFLFLALSSVIKRAAPRQQRWFSWLGVTLMLLVSIILVSAYQRLLLYESAYGFTRLRTYSHIFMVWLGLLLLAVVIFELLNRRRAVVFATLMAALGFSASLALLNVDAFIVRANFERPGFGEETASAAGSRSEEVAVDVGYLVWLSPDAMVGFDSAYDRALQQGETDLATQIAGAAFCHALIHDDFRQAGAWQGWHFSPILADNAWSRIKAQPHYQDLNIEVISLSDLQITVDDRDSGCGYFQGWD